MSIKSMDEKETRKRLLEIAKKEFIELGYEKASLRSICKKADMTTGAVYYFFKDKKDMYQQLVVEFVNILEEVIREHFTGELEEYMPDLSKNHKISAAKESEVKNIDRLSDLDTMRKIIHIMYEHKDEVILLLVIGPNKESVIDYFVAMLEDHYMKIAVAVEGEEAADDYLIHWISHIQVESFIFLISHIEDVHEAEKEMEKIITFQTAGWYSVFPNFVRN